MFIKKGFNVVIRDRVIHGQTIQQQKWQEKKQKKTKLNMEQHEPYKKPEWTLEDKLLFH